LFSVEMFPEKAESPRLRVMLPIPVSSGSPEEIGRLIPPDPESMFESSSRPSWRAVRRPVRVSTRVLTRASCPEVTVADRRSNDNRIDKRFIVSPFQKWGVVQAYILL
jgi:hypothetical protein